MAGRATLLRAAPVGRRRRARVVAAGTLTALVLGALPAASATDLAQPVAIPLGGAAVEHVAPAGRPTVDGALTLVQRTRAAVDGGGFAAPLAGLIWPSGDRPAPPAAAAPAPRHLRAAAALPARLRVPVSGLFAAVDQAAALLGDVSPEDLHRAIAASRREPFLRPPGRDDRSTSPLERSADGRVLAPVGPYPDSVARAVAAAPAAAAVLAAALDRHLPALRAAAGTPTGASAAACDLVNQVPLLCVSSEADQAHTANAMLSIDLGGSDSYATSSGGAPFVLPGGEQLASVSVSIDLGGNDVYGQGTPIVTGLPVMGNRNGPTAVTSPTVVTQGAALFGAVGLLVDAAGDDSYSAAAAEVTPEAPVATVMAQGTGLEAIGALFDLGGRDRYAATAPGGMGTATVSAQGSGQGECGAGALGIFKQITCRSGLLGGVLVDRGGTADEYVLSSGPASGRHTGESDAFTSGIPLRALLGQGAAWVGFGALVDDGGTDRLSAAASSLGPEHLPDADLEPPFAVVQVQGVAQGGLGLLLTGVGDTSYDVAARGTDRVNWHLIRVQGAGSGQGTAVLSDLGGDDEYRLTSTVDLDVEQEVADAVQRWDHDFAEVLHTVVAQGFGDLGSAGLLIDGDGDDRYHVADLQHVDVRTHDARGQAGRLAVRTQGLTFGLGAQGAGIGHGVGYLLDGGGTDHYSAVARNSVRATGTAAAQPDPVVTAVSLPAWVYAQGASLGTQTAGLVDVAGAGDRFVVDALNPAQTAPDPDGAFQHGKPVYAHGSAAGGDPYSATFVALGEAPQITSSPSEPTCQTPAPTRRGAGHWTHCGSSASALSGGFAPRSVASPSTLVLEAPASAPHNYDFEPTPSAERLDVAATVTAASGAPVEGALVHFRISRRGGLVAAYAPSAPLWGVSATTGPDGVAEARLPLLATGLLPEGGQWFVEAMYDGSTGGIPLLPAHAVAPVALEG